MRMKSVLLGSAAALGFGGAAQAADLGVPFEAEPVDYVRVCDAFGTGYYYIPGTDTCLKLSGYVRFEARFFSTDVNVNAGGTTHEDHYRFFTRGSLTVEGRSQTDWGPLVGVITLEGDFVSPSRDGDAFAVDDTLLSLGPLYAGYTQSLFDQIGGGYGLIGLDGGVAITDTKVQTIGLNWAFNGFGLAIALEDNRYRADDFFDDVSEAGDFPDLVAALFGEWGNLAAAVSFLYMDTDNTFGVQGYAEAANLGILDLLAGASYLNGDSGDVFSVLAGLRANWMANLSSSINVRWDECGGYASCDDGWFVSFDTRYEPVNNFLIAGGVAYEGEEEEWEARLRLQRNIR